MSAEVSTWFWPQLRTPQLSETVLPGTVERRQLYPSEFLTHRLCELSIIVVVLCHFSLEGVAMQLWRTRASRPSGSFREDRTTLRWEPLCFQPVAFSFYYLSTQHILNQNVMIWWVWSVSPMSSGEVRSWLLWVCLFVVFFVMSAAL